MRIFLIFKANQHIEYKKKGRPTGGPVMEGRRFSSRISFP